MDMNFNNTDNEKLTGNMHSNRSILGAMKGFIDAVNEMDETVLIPSLLMDMQVGPETVVIEKDKLANGKDISLVPLRNDNSLLSGPESLRNDETVSLHACYSMLKAVKCELIRGPMSAEDHAAVDGRTNGFHSVPTTGKQSLEEATARAFREHLLGLFGVLQKLTNVSKTLTCKYQEELGDYQSCIKPKAPFLL